MKPSPPPAQSIRELPMTKAAASTVLMKPEKFWIPSGEYKIPLEGSSDQAKTVLVCPPTVINTKQGGPEWRPQICNVIDGAAVYVNESKTPFITSSTPTSELFRWWRS